MWSKSAPLGARLPSASQRRGERSKKSPSRRELLELRPVRNPVLEWYEEDGHVVLHIKRVKNWKTRLLELLIPLPQDRHVVLDAIGTDVWQMLDGQTTIGQIAITLGKKYKLTSREVEISLQQFFKELGQRGYVAFFMEQAAASERQPKQPKSKQQSKKSNANR